MLEEEYLISLLLLLLLVVLLAVVLLLLLKLRFVGATGNEHRSLVTHGCVVRVIC